MTSFRRTRAAILEAAKTLVAKQGYSSTSMIDIADTAEVSRATLYNHFRDKVSVYRALLEDEITRIFKMAALKSSSADSLTYLAGEISGDRALAMLRGTDLALVTELLTSSEHPLWSEIARQMELVFESKSPILLSWLIAQALQPLESGQILNQVALLTSIQLWQEHRCLN